MLKQAFVATILVSFTHLAQADDTELYITDVSAQNGLKPQVMIIFDNSGSMRNTETMTKESFDSTKSYGELGTGKIYWAKSGDDVPSKSSDQFFFNTENNCHAAVSPLNMTGKYTGNLRRWDATSSSWRQLSGSNGDLFDCREDIDSAQAGNPGLGKDGYPSNGNKEPYAAAPSNNIFKGSDGVTLYTEKYLYWYHQSDTVKKSRLAIAQETISELVRSTPSVNFGLTVFNYNSSDAERNGGRIVRAITDMSAVDRTSFTETINSQEAKGNTPLCESLYEVYRYYAGLGVYFGDDDTDLSGYVANQPPRDAKAESPAGTYASPYKTCQDKAYVILMTDGAPTHDGMASTLIKNLTNGSPIHSSYMPALANFMYNNDINLSKEGKQTLSTYTIGFGDGATTKAGKLLSETAKQGGGEYFPASGAKELQQAFQDTIIKILDQSSSFNAPAVSATSFDRTQHQDAIYYSMFIPSKKQRWRGNIKKLKIDAQGVLRDVSNQAAIDDNGNIKEGVSTAWGGKNDGNAVTQGGVAAAITKQSKRTLYTNSAEQLVSLSSVTIKNHFGAATDAELAATLGIKEEGLTRRLNWLFGYDVDDLNEDNDTTDFRDDIFGDPLHSKPTAITYSSQDSDQTRLLVGTNAGFIHFFHDKGDSITEEWAFIPAELLEHGLELIEDKDVAEHPYGMDGTASVFEIGEGNSKQIIAVIGMRRGGHSYYAFDLTAPSSPKLLWHVSNKTVGFEQLGQTWSKPQTGYIDASTPVFVFGGGYDVNQDNCTKANPDDCSDESGRGIYIVKAKTGEKVWSSNLDCDESSSHCMKHSSPAEVTAFDSDNNGFMDRIYSVDLGGNIWRTDLSGSVNDWGHIKIASLSNAGSNSDRRIFNAPTVVRTLSQKVVALEEGYQTYDQAIDMVLVGTGNRAKPASDRSNKDIFVMVKDPFILPTQFTDPDIEHPFPITTEKLFDITDNPIASSTDLLLSRSELSSLSGWQYKFSEAGEKALGGALVISGTVYFTSFTPSVNANLQCGIGELGLGRLYAVSIFDGTYRHNWHKKEIGNRVPDTLVVHSGKTADNKSALRLLGVGQGETLTILTEDPNEPDGQKQETVNSGTQSTDADLNPKRVYSYFEEQ